jgi:hypothetical protein
MAGEVRERRARFRVDPIRRGLMVRHPAVRQRLEIAATGRELLDEDLREGQPAVRNIAQRQAPAGGESDQGAGCAENKAGRGFGQA